MHEVLLVYKQIEMLFDDNGELFIPAAEHDVHTYSYDEKPGIQAISSTGKDLNPTTKCGTIKRDYEYKRLGTVSLLAAIDLLTGEAIPLVRDKHTSDEFIDFLKILNEKYPEGDIIRVILDNYTVHTSKKVKAFFATMPGRFIFIFTPKHGSWLNMIEGFFGKMTRQMLKGIRVSSKQELIDRIYKLIYCLLVVKSFAKLSSRKIRILRFVGIYFCMKFTEREVKLVSWNLGFQFSKD